MFMIVMTELCVSSRGAGTALAFGLVLIELLFGRERANEIGASIML